MKMRIMVLLAAVGVMALLLPAHEAAAATNLAVFNFQLKTGQDDWVWLEKFMSDQMATDLVQDRSLSVIARDRMQLLAQKMKWAPEFATRNPRPITGRRHTQASSRARHGPPGSHGSCGGHVQGPVGHRQTHGEHEVLQFQPQQIPFIHRATGRRPAPGG